MPSASKRVSESSKQLKAGKQREQKGRQSLIGIESIQHPIEDETENVSDVDQAFGVRDGKVLPVLISPPQLDALHKPHVDLQALENERTAQLSLPKPQASPANSPPNDWSAWSQYANGNTLAHAYVENTSPPNINHGYLSMSPSSESRGQPINHPHSQPNSLPSYAGRSPPTYMADFHRRASMVSNYGNRTLSGRAPLPHEHQPHFNGLPQVDFGSTRQISDLNIGPKTGAIHFRCLDTLDGTGEAGSAAAANVILTGRDGGVDVHELRHDGLRPIGSLDGLRGKAIGAKLLKTSHSRHGTTVPRPLLAVVLHGPLRAAVPESAAGDEIEHAISESPPEKPNTSSEVQWYQTTVEVYSLATSSFVAQLYRSPATPLPEPRFGDDPDMPPPPCDFALETKGDYLVMALGGRYGELFIFELNSTDETCNFRCLGKLWTSVQPRQQAFLMNTQAPAAFDLDADTSNLNAAPIFSLSSRWLAIVPPASSSQFSLYGSLTSEDAGNHTPGLDISMSPPPPTINCAVDTPNSTFVDRVAREAGKTFVKGAQWLGDQGKQLWKSYMASDTNPTASAGSRLNSGLPAPIHQEPKFPPTHATHTFQPLKTTPVIAVYDLQRLARSAQMGRSKNAPDPLAVFEQTLGCSFLSFSPSGLYLLTASSKGDIQVLFDLKRICHGRGAPLSTAGTSLLGPHVREVTRFTRVTDATIVDAIWNPPRDEKLALLTEKGTLHVHSMPASVFTWPLPRRVVPEISTKTSPSSTPAKSSSPDPPFNSQRSRFNTVVDGASAWLSTRSRSLSNGPAVPAFSSFSLSPTVGAGAKTARAAASTASKTISDSVSYVRHLQDNKIHIYQPGQQPQSGQITSGSAMWLTGAERGMLACLAGEKLSLHKVSTTTRGARGKSKGLKSVSVSPLAPVDLPAVGRSNLQQHASRFPNRATIGLPINDRAPAAPMSSQPSGFWRRSPLLSNSPRNQDSTSSKVIWKSYAELATTSGYQKFHTDPRVSLYVYDNNALIESVVRSESSKHSQSERSLLTLEERRKHHHVDDPSPWVFGLDIPHKQVTSGAIAAARAGVVSVEDGTGDIIWSSGVEGTAKTTGDDEGEYDMIDFADNRV